LPIRKQNDKKGSVGKFDGCFHPKAKIPVIFKDLIMKVLICKDNLRKTIFVILIFLGVLYLIAFQPLAPPKKNVQKVPKSKDSDKLYISLRALPNPVEKKPVKKPKKRIKKKVDPHYKYTRSKSYINKGRASLGKRGQKIGSFPEIKANYRKHLGINGYLTAMERLGGSFYILNMDTGDIAAQIDTRNRALSLKKNLSGLSPRSRLIENEPTLFQYIKIAQNAFGNGNFAVILLLPLEIDHYIIGALSDTANKIGEDIKNFSTFYGVYVMRGRDLYLGIYKGRLKSGHIKKLNVSLRLTT